MSHRRWPRRLTARLLGLHHHRRSQQQLLQPYSVWTRVAAPFARQSFGPSLLLASAVAVAVGCYVRCEAAAAPSVSASASASASSAVSDSDEYALLSPLARSGGAGDMVDSSASPSARPAPVPASSLPSRLSSGAVRVAVQRGGVESIEVSCYNANPAIEDSWLIEPQLLSDPSGGCAVVGVFDGHSGSAASIWLRRHILGFLQRQWQSGQTDQLLHPRAFVEADRHFIDRSWREGRPADGLSGACFNLVQVRDGEVRCASAGDVRAIVGRRRAGSAAAAGAVRDGRQPSTHVAVPLSWDHQIDVNPNERERLLAAHPNEADVIRRNRVKGRLQPTRGFGDAAYKELRYWHYRTATQQSATSSGRAATTAYTPPYTTAEPDVYNYRLQAGDEFIIVSTDGLFQDMSSQEAVDYAAAYLAQQRDREQQHSSASPSVSSRSSWLPQWARSSSSSGSSGSSSSSSSSASIVSRLSSVVWPSCSSFLASRALLHASEKHIGRRQTDADNLSWVAQLPIGERRAVHDDCTVMIIHLAHGTGGSDITATAQITGDDAAESQFHIQSKL